MLVAPLQVAGWSWMFGSPKRHLKTSAPPLCLLSQGRTSHRFSPPSHLPIMCMKAVCTQPDQILRRDHPAFFNSLSIHNIFRTQNPNFKTGHKTTEWKEIILKIKVLKRRIIQPGHYNALYTKIASSTIVILQAQIYQAFISLNVHSAIATYQRQS